MLKQVTAAVNFGSLGSKQQQHTAEMLYFNILNILIICCFESLTATFLIEVTFIKQAFSGICLEILCFSSWSSKQAPMYIRTVSRNIIMRWRPYWLVLPLNRTQESAYGTRELALWVHLHQSWKSYQTAPPHKHGKHTWGPRKVVPYQPIVIMQLQWLSWSRHIKYSLAHSKGIQPQQRVLFESSALLKMVLELLTLQWH